MVWSSVLGQVFISAVKGKPGRKCLHSVLKILTDFFSLRPRQMLSSSRRNTWKLIAANTFIVIKQLRPVAKYLSVLCTHYSFHCKLKEWSDGLDPHFKIPQGTLRAMRLSTEMMHKHSIKIWNTAGGDRDTTIRLYIQKFINILWSKA